MHYNISVDSLESMDSPSKAHRCELAGFTKSEAFLQILNGFVHQHPRAKVRNTRLTGS